MSHIAKRVVSLFAALAVAAGLASCAPSPEQDRAATSDWPAQVTCPDHSSWSAPVDVVNTTAVAMKLQAGEIDCYDWSGVSTPPTVFNNQIVDAKSVRTFTLEARDNVNRYWSMRFATATGQSVNLGGARIRLAQGSGTVIPKGSDPQSTETKLCVKFPLGSDPTTTASPPISQIQAHSRIVLWSDGSTIFLLSCNSDFEWSGF